jgi:hypothetical protein
MKAMSLDLIRSRAQWYRDGCDCLDNRDGYLRDGLATDAADDLDAAIAMILELRDRLDKAEAWHQDANRRALDHQSQKQWWQSRCEKAFDAGYKHGLLTAIQAIDHDYKERQPSSHYLGSRAAVAAVDAVKDGTFVWVKDE